MKIKHLIIFCMMSVLLGCKDEQPTYQAPDDIQFTETEHLFGVIDNQEWFEVEISAARIAKHDRNIGVEVITSESSATENLHFNIESNTVTIPAGELTTVVRIKGIAENIDITEQPKIILELVLNEEEVNEAYGIRTEITLQRCCPFDMDNFAGYAKTDYSRKRKESCYFRI